MRSIYGEESSPSDVHGSSAHEEKILVSVRLRPLNEKELSKNDFSDWECVNNTTIISKSSAQDRPMSPTAYSFDRVFGNDSTTRQVYEEGAKKVALSVTNGINASIFAYGQTSSGKTYTMTGITEYTLSDIYNYVNQHETREFVLKFAAMEIYNESVRDLLTSEDTTLRLLDDPVRGTVVAKLTEVTLRDWDHLKELLSVCEAQRQIGETTLNEMSSRSHQILRLTVESRTRKYSTSRSPDVLTATVNFVDLAGSERASQTMSVSTRLKEGCHINRSLLTLGTVIRKLSKGRNGHVPYRDSKLTRILQNSLGGNARTAIICTLSPAHSHVEQSRNTLLFASCAKQVTNTAQVNVVMSEKALVRLLKKELARLQKELKNLVSLSSGSCDSLSALQEKERLIEKMDKEIRELTQQRDFAHARLQNFQVVDGQSRCSRSWANSSTISDSSHEIGVWPDYYSPSEVSDIWNPFRSEITSNTSQRVSDRYMSTIGSNNTSQRLSDRYMGTTGSNKIEDFETEEKFLSDELSPTKFIDQYFGPDPSLGWEKMAHTSNQNILDIYKEIQYVEVEVDKRSLKYEEVPLQHSSGHQELRTGNDNETSKIDALDIMNNTSNCRHDISRLVEQGSPYSSDIDNISNDSKSNDDILMNKICGEIMAIVSSEVKNNSEKVIQSRFEEETPGKIVEVDNLKVSDELNNDDEKVEDREDKIEISNEENVDQQPNNMKVFDELNHDNEKLEDREDKTETSNEENVDEQHDCSTSFKEDYGLKCQEQFGDNSKDTIEDKKLDSSLSNEDSVESLECQKQIVENSASDAEDVVENLECQKQIVENDGSDVSSIEDENLECHNQLKDNITSEDENLECQNLIVDNHMSEDENIERENHLVDNPMTVVVPSIDNGNFQCEEKSVDNDVLKIKPTSDKKQDLSYNDSEVVDDSQLSSSNWSIEFEKKRREIIELWNACNVPLVHRTYFFLLFKGEPSDSIYMEVEQRRLSYLKSTLSRSSDSSSLKTLRREREKLRRQLQKKFSVKERYTLYGKWGIAPKSKRRRVQLCSRLWTDTKDMEHVKESAALVAKLVGLVEPNHAPKEIFGLSLPQSTSFRSSSWQSLPSLL